MPMEFIVPSVQIDESDVGPRPTAQLSLAAIGIVGTFKKGPLNTVTTIGDAAALITQFGDYGVGLTGYISSYATLQQGANDLRIVRIAGIGAKSATATLNDGTATPAPSIVVTAINEGTWGNATTVSVINNGTTFDLTAVNGTYSETFKGLSLTNLTITSKLVMLETAAGAVALPKTTTAAVALTTGSDGAAVADADYIGKIDSLSGNRSGLSALEPEQVGIVICAQQSSPAMHAALLSFFDGCDIDEGLRVGILNTAIGKPVDLATAQTTTLDSERGIFAYPWVEPDWLPGVYVAPDGYYAGRLSYLEPHKSPSNKQIMGITSCEGTYTYAQVKKLTLARISPITLVNGRGFRIRNGLTLSSDPAWCQTNIRRQQDKMEMELYRAMQWAISEPHAEPLWDAIKTQVDMYLQVQKNLGLIRGYKKTICDKTVNTSEMVTNRILTTIIRWLPLYAADFIILRFKREITTDN